VCGDWVNGSRVEGALTSGVAAARRLLGLEPVTPAAPAPAP
jgi:predicted NAD/FAD-dependent oxidoreductase